VVYQPYTFLTLIKKITLEVWSQGCNSVYLNVEGALVYKITLEVHVEKDFDVSKSL